MTTVVKLPRERLDENGDRERLCTRCLEYWPADKEFFFSGGRSGLHTWCKACVAEYKRSRQEKTSGSL